MKREGWERHLNDYIKASEPIAFVWGETDCCLWVARFIDSVTGSELAREWEGQYNTSEGAQAFMESKGFSCPADIADAYLCRKDIRKLGRGDVAMFEGGALGICTGRKTYFFVEGKALTGLPTLKCLKAWEV